MRERIISRKEEATIKIVGAVASYAVPGSILTFAWLSLKYILTSSLTWEKPILFGYVGMMTLLAVYLFCRLTRDHYNAFDRAFIVKRGFGPGAALFVRFAAIAIAVFLIFCTVILGTAVILKSIS